MKIYHNDMKSEAGSLCLKLYFNDETLSGENSAESCLTNSWISSEAGLDCFFLGFVGRYLGMYHF